MKLQEKDFAALLTYLLYDKKHSSSPHNIHNVQFRYRFLYKYFSENNLEFNRVNFTAFIQYMKEKGYANNTINNFIKIGKHIDKYFKVGEIQDYTYFPKENTPPDILSAEQIAEMMAIDIEYDRDCEEKNRRYKAIIHTMFLTGARISEVLALTWNDLKKITRSDGSEAFIVVLNQMKTNELRYAPISEILFMDLSALPHYSFYVFSTKKGEQLRKNTVSKDLKRRAEACGIDKNVYNHMMRHSFIRFMLRNGAPLTTVSHMVGHKSIETTYKHYTDGLIEEYIDTLYGYHPHLKKQQTLTTVEKRVRDMIHSFLDLSRYSVHTKAQKNKVHVEITEHD